MERIKVRHEASTVDTKPWFSENLKSRLPGAGDETIGEQGFLKLTTLKQQ